MRPPRPSRAAPPPAGGGLAAALLDELFGQRTVGVAVVGRDGRYLRVNETLAEMNRVAAEDHVGRTIGEVLPEAAELLEGLLDSVLAGEVIDDLEVAAPVADGRRFRVSYLPVRPDGGEVAAALALVIETTEHEHAQRRLRITAERLRLALEGTATAMFEWSIGADDVRWSDTGGPLLGREPGWAPDGLDGFLAIAHPDDRAALAADFRAAAGDGRDFEREWRIVREGGEVRWLHARAHALRSSDGSPYALVGVFSDVTARRRREYAAEFLARASLALSTSLDATATLREIARMAVPEIADWCTVHVVEEDGALGAVAAEHADPAVAGRAEELRLRFPPDPHAAAGVPGVVRTGRAELYPQITGEQLAAFAQDEDHRGALERLGLSSVMIVPMVAGGRTLGAVSFVSAESRRRYDGDDLELAEELGRRAGVALDNARLHAAERRTNARLRRLQAVTDVALTHLELDELLDELLRRICEVTASDIAVVLLVDEDGDELVLRAAVGLDGEATHDVRVPVGAGVAGTIAATRAPLILDDVSRAAPHSAHLEAAASLAGVPLVVDGRVLGVLHVSTRSPRRFTSDDLRLLELVADRVAHGIARARAYDRAREVAVTLQRSMLPLALPPVAGLEMAVRYLPGQEGTEVGGDWYDLFPLAGGRCGVVVGDVVGRGVHAAATMGQLRSALRAYAHEDGRPAATLSRLDDLAVRLDPIPYATILLAELDPATGEATIGTAGHPLPIVRDGDGDGACRLLEVEVGPPLAVLGGRRADSTVLLGPHDTLVLYTDGLVERRGRSLDDRFDELLEATRTGPDDLGELLDHVLAEMVGRDPSRDDTALVALRRSS